jgi:hypothetical protein
MGRMPSSYGRTIAIAEFDLAFATESPPEAATTPRSCSQYIEQPPQIQTKTQSNI